MAVTIHVNGTSNSLVHKGSMGIAKSTIPDVCKTPSPGGPVPIPYPIIVSMSSDLKKGTKTVKVDSKNMAAIKGSEFTRCSGDEPGTVGGIKSSTNMKEATWILYSFDVKLDGKNACRLSDKMMMNHGNTACLSGESQIIVPGAKINVDICSCCKGPKHANQKGADQVSEEEWYGADGYEAVKKARKMGCECVPETADEDCGVYYKQPDSKKSQKARHRWNTRYKKDFISRWNAAGKTPSLVYETDPKKEGDKIAHKTPISAGGCIKGNNNLMPNKAMSQDCQDMDDELSKHHSIRSVHFQV